jgi:hypothetical protein
MTDELIEPSNPDLWDSPETVQAYVGALEDEIERLRAALEKCAAEFVYVDENGLVGHEILAREFSVRQGVACAALSPERDS